MIVRGLSANGNASTSTSLSGIDLTHHVKIVLVVSKARDDFVAIVHVHAEFDARISRAESREELGGNIFGCGDDPEAQPATANAFAIGDPGIKIVEYQEQLLAGCEKILAGIGRANVPAVLLKQRQADDVRQFFHLNRDRRLREIQFLCRPGVTSIANDRREYLKLTEGDMSQERFEVSALHPGPMALFGLQYWARHCQLDWLFRQADGGRVKVARMANVGGPTNHLTVR
jgi:hypothetical protein